MGLPGGTVTLVLGDVEASTERWEASTDDMTAAMAALNAAVDELVASHNGARPREQGEGDSFVAAFTKAADAVAFAIALQEVSPLPVRIGIHTGDVDVVDQGYAGPAIIRAARLRDAGHGGQVLLSNATAALVADGVGLDDLGEHQLKGLTRPEHVWQLPGEFPALRLTDDAPPAPLRLTGFIGRELELAHVRDLVKEPGCVTITGAGGAGKTRLALELMASQPGWFVDLAAVDRDEGVVTTVADAVGARIHPNRSAAEAIASTIRDTDALLVLDNCEHLLASCGDLAAGLLSRCGRLTILATSREPLGLDGEVTYRLPSLGEIEAHDLFVERARRADPRFSADDSVIAEICQRLDGMPLAIELAAARIRVFTAPQLLDALHDRFRLLTGGARTAMPRQRTLEASVDWSYALLLDAERTLLRRLSVFAGSFTLDAAVAVAAGGDLEAHHVFDLLVALVEKSLVAPDERTPGRFRMLETIRHYATARLVDAGESDDCRRRHYDFFLRVANHGHARSEDEWRAAVALDEPNIRRALQWASDQPGYEALFALTEELALYWNQSRRSGEGQAWLERLDARTRDAPANVRCQVLRDRSLITTTGGDWVEAGALALEAIDLARASGDDRLLLSCALYCNPALRNANCMPDGFVEEALELARQSADPRAMALMTCFAGFNIMREQGDVIAGQPVIRDAVAQLRAAGMTRMAATAEAWLAMGEAILGNFAAAIPLINRAAEALRESGETFILTNLLAISAAARYGTGDELGADRDVAELDDLAREAGDVQTALNRAIGHGLLHSLRGEWPAAVAALAPFRHLSGSDSLVAPLRSMLGVALAMDGQLEDAEAIAASTAEVPSTGGLAIGSKAITQSIAASHHGDEAKAWEIAYEGWVKVPALPMFGGLLVIFLARSGARLGRFEESARLAGWLLRDLEHLPAWKALLEETERRCRAALGDDRYEQLAAEGATLTQEQAFALVRRGRGSRARPMLGWHSLTSTEAEVAALVAQGLTNKDVAGQLFMSEATVKTHLTRIYAKVGVKTRAQLAASRASP